MAYIHTEAEPEPANAEAEEQAIKVFCTGLSMQGLQEKGMLTACNQFSSNSLHLTFTLFMPRDPSLISYCSEF